MHGCKVFNETVSLKSPKKWDESLLVVEIYKCWKLDLTTNNCQCSTYRIKIRLNLYLLLLATKKTTKLTRLILFDLCSLGRPWTPDPIASASSTITPSFSFHLLFYFYVYGSSAHLCLCTIWLQCSKTKNRVSAVLERSYRWFILSHHANSGTWVLWKTSQ